jgi:hypothetical protein
MQRISAFKLTRNRVVALVFICSTSFLGSLSFQKFYNEIFVQIKSTQVKSIPEFQKMIRALENSFAEHAFMRNIFAGIDANVGFYLTKELTSRQVLKGKDNWLFYKSRTDGMSMDDYQGISSFDDSKLRSILEKLTSTKSTLNSMGIRFILLIPSNKERIYSNKMPDAIPIVNKYNRTDKLVSYLRENAFDDVIYPKEELLSHRGQFQLYYKHDTHWNILGGFIAEQQLLEKLYGKRGTLLDQNVIKKIVLQKDLAKMVNMEWFFDDDYDYSLESLDPMKSDTDTCHVNENARYDNSILLIGDSFMKAFAPHICNDFKKACIINRSNYSPEILKTCSPDIVVIEFVERYSDQLSTWNLF